MAKFPLKKNDLVIVRSGKDRGKTGKVLKVLPEDKKVVVEKVNFVKIFVRPDRSQNIQGGIMEKEAPLPVSRVMLYCQDCGRGVRVRYKILEDGTKIRVCSRCQTNLEKS
ncbi:MAG TPA: 50S ribosomal protein L24 [Candidatus Saccharicenans sp.]|mgnify:CR=1 FL=1|jgi:large subunit ribosomal protein L24|nr:50S ribosomal protein L24 [Candidatus Saccharicenans sp.]HNS04939.1 50S ribosomal protein L24 [Candidatus Saccharicenans sp.]HNT02017.1 50S ribosomal protein L24 [Candidatus Saccharicenans sp.]HPB59487.1 50S ribosomal protein L24 [Candidatus Saccharicenans sp.]